MGIFNIIILNQDNNEEKLLFKPEYKKYADRENANNELKRLLKNHVL
mgnify:CR=1 FL=1